MKRTEKPTPPIRLAVTGAWTQVGRRVLRDLDRLGEVERVLVFDVQPPDSDDGRVHFLQTDLTQPGVEAEIAAALEEHAVNTFLHAAFLWNTVRDSEWAHELESVGTDRVLAAVSAAKVHRLVVTSSVTVYGITHRNATPLTEDAALISARTLPPWREKVAAETAVARFAAAHPETCVTVIRSAILLDPAGDRAISRTLRGRFIPMLMGFDPLFQFLHPDDLAEAYARALREDHPGVFNVAPEDAIPLSRFIEMGRKVAIPLPHLPAMPLYGLLWAAGIGEVHPSFLNFLRFSLIANGSKARAEFGFAPRSTYATVDDFLRATERESA